jgi:4-diphosphocytidyl-2-C-methyl-D-erythritol kinase
LSGGVIRARARAKVNLYLHVTGRRADGYHELDSLVMFADYGDRLTAEPAAELALSIDGPFAAGLSTGPDNLVLKAATALRDALMAKGLQMPGARILLEKNLPVASGIGGGSADAAAALRALLALWSPPAGLVDPMALGLRLGADLPVCLASGPRFVGGIGDRLAPAPGLPRVAVLLVNPRVAISTPAAFARRKGAFSAPARWTEPLADARALARRLADRRNDLLAPALELAPVVGEVLGAIERLPGALLARLSGSGATCFGLFEDLAAASAAAGELARDRADWWVAAADLLASDAEPPLPAVRG